MTIQFFGPVSNLERRLQVVAMFVATALSFLLMWNVAGPWRWLVMAQVALFGGYEGTLTFVLTTILCWLPMAGALRLFVQRGERSEVPEHFASKPSQIWNRIDTCGRWIYRWIFCTLPGEVIVVGLFFLGFSTVSMIRQGDLRVRQEVEIADLERGIAPDSRWLVVKGVPVVDAAIGITHPGKRIYIPLASDASPQSPIAACVVMSDYEFVPGLVQRQRRWEGVVDNDGLPALARLEFEKLSSGVAEECLVVELGKSPEKVFSKTRGALVLGLVLLGFGSILLTITLLLNARQAPSST